MKDLVLDILKVNQYILKHQNEFNKEIGGLIKEIRLNKKINKDEMATNIFMSPSYITKIEKGIVGIKLNRFIMICNCLKVHPKEILDSFLFNPRINEDILFNELQNGKNITTNILDYIKNKD